MPTRITEAPSGKDKPLGRRERNKLIKRERIVAAARALFAVQGFAETTTQQIAAAADIGTGTLFLYARSKEDLLLMVFKDEMLETALDSFRHAQGEQPVIAKIMGVFDRMLAYHERDIETARILLRELIIPSSGRDAEIETLMLGILGGFTELIRDAQAAGEVAAAIEPGLAGEMIFALYYFGLLGWASQRTSRPEFFDQLQRQLQALLGRPALPETR